MEECRSHGRRDKAMKAPTTRRVPLGGWGKCASGGLTPSPAVPPGYIRLAGRVEAVIGCVPSR